MQLEVNRFVLGTAQFGSDYGISNRAGQPSKAKIFEILSLAWESGIRRFDTAPDYDSEKILGEFIRAHGVGDIVKVSTKIAKIKTAYDYKNIIRQELDKSVDLLGCSIDVLFMHNASDADLFIMGPEYFQNLLGNYPIHSFGVSVYEPSEVFLLQQSQFDLAVQFPLNILDQRFEQLELTPGKLYARSIFLQGLLASKNYLKPWAPKSLVKFHSIYHRLLLEQGLDPISCALSFVFSSDATDFILLGVETSEQLKNIVEAEILERSCLDTVFSALPIIKPELLDPRKW
jgi:aryl-alcohol dehydrogenase-like predicted oxidoreductase